MRKEINKEILAIALPAIVSNVTTPLLGLVDTAIVGHIGSATYIGAIALGSTMFNLLYWLFGFLRMSTAGLTSQSFGSSDFLQSCRNLKRSMLLAVTFSLLLLLLSPWLGPIVLNFLDADDTVQPLAIQYFRIVIWGAPAVLGTYVLNGWLLGMQNTRLPMMVAIVTNIFNIILSASLVFGLGMKIEGVAIGTLTSQWLGFAICMVALWRKYSPVKVGINELINLPALRRIFKLNIDIFLRTLCMIIVTAWFTRSGATQGVEILAANALLMQMFMFFSYFSDGFGFAGEALAGKYYGMNDSVGLKSVEHLLLIWGGWIALAFTILYFFCGDFVLKLLTDDKALISVTLKYLPWAVCVPFCGIMAFIYDGIFVGLTLTRRMLISVAAGMVAFFAIYYGFKAMLGNHALWIAFLAYLLIRGVSLKLLLPKCVLK